MRLCLAASVVDEPLWPAELADSELAKHPVYQVPIVVIAGRLLPEIIIYISKVQLYLLYIAVGAVLRALLLKHGDHRSLKVVERKYSFFQNLESA